MSRDARRLLLHRMCSMWFLLDKKTQDDLIDGKCVYSEYNNVPIIDYTQKHPMFYDGEAA